MKIQYDDDALAIIEKVNKELLGTNLEFRLIDDDRDGYIEYELRDFTKTTIDHF